MPVDTDLHKAAHQGDFNTVEDLISQGEIDVNAKGAADRTALHRACGGNHVKVAKFLIEHGADVDMPDKNGRAPIHWACIGGHHGPLQLLLDNKCKVNVATKGGMTALHAAAEGKAECVKVLLKYHMEGDGEKLDFEAKDAEGNTAYLIAKKDKNKEIEKALKEVGAGGADAQSGACIMM